MFRTGYTAQFSGLIDPELIDAICQKRCILFVGSGVSANASYVKSPLSTGTNLPTWGRLLREMLNRARGLAGATPSWLAQVENLLDKGQHLVAAQELQDMLTRNGVFGAFLQSLFGISNIRLGIYHQLIPDIGFRAVITTNFDTLIEEAYLTRGIPVITLRQRDFLRSPVRKSPLPIRPTDDFFVLKLHGDYTDPTSIVAGTLGFQDVMFNSRGLRQFLETVFSVYTVVFLGFSGTDPHLSVILDDLSSLYRDRSVHFIVLAEDPTDDPNRPQVNLTAVEKHRWESDRFVRVLTYDFDRKRQDHRQLEALLADLSNLKC